jgi:regulator of sigma E protease
MNFLVSIPAFIVAIAILVTIHEFGHYWVARKMGVKVLRFSIGFGKPLWSRVAGKDQTEYIIAAIPLGGYVKMLDEREAPVEEHEQHRAFNRQSVWKRIAIVVAGPLFNFLLAIFLYSIVFILGTNAMQPLIGEVSPNSPAATAEIPSDGKVLAINSTPVASWDETRMAFLAAYLKNNQQIVLNIESPDNNARDHTLDLSAIPLLKTSEDFLEKIGIFAWRPKQVIRIDQVLPDSAALAGGLQKNDVLLRVDDQPIHYVTKFIKYIQQHGNQKIALVIERQNQEIRLTIPLTEKNRQGQMVGSLGAQLSSKVADNLSESDQQKLNDLFFVYQHGVVDSLVLGVEKTWQMSVLTLKMMGRLIIGEASLKNISGPVTIAEFAGKTALAGITVYLGFLAIISVSLGVLNLLPIPMLDGGHLLYYIIELLTGKPVPEAVQEVGFRIGIALVGSMMMLALYNDIVRLIN